MVNYNEVRQSLLAIIPGLVALTFTACGLPKDQTLLAKFYNYRSNFERLRSMFLEDSVSWIDASDSERAILTRGGELDNTRLVEYNRLFKQIGLRQGLRKRRDGQMWFLVDSSGILNRGASKGYVYSERLLSPCVTSDLDTFTPKSQERVAGSWVVFRKLNNNWYMFREVG